METCFKILQLKFDQKLTNRCIGLTMKISASTVFEVLARFKATSLPWPLPEAISHDGLEKLIFPAKGIPASERVMPDLLHFDTEMRKSGVTRQLLWMEYKAQAGELAMGYSHFCRCYREWKKTRRLSMRQEHRAGEKLFIDFCGPTVPVINPDTRLRELLADMNNRPMKGYGNQSRAERFRVLDAPALSSLPLAAYE